MSDPLKDPRRVLYGLRVHRDVDWNYGFWRPKGWTQHYMTDEYGFIYSPGDNPLTGFGVAVRDLSAYLDGPVTEEDLPALHEGALEGLKQLEDCQILEEKEIAKGFAIGFEFLLTFTLDGQTVKRRTRLLYNDRQQFTIFGQGTPPYEYDVFHDTYEYIYLTFVFTDPLVVAGVPPQPHTATVWEGDEDKVQTRPDTPRDHSAWAAERIAEIDAKIEGQKDE